MRELPGGGVAPAGIAAALSSREFEQISALAYERFGLDLRKGKEHLIAARLGKKMRELGVVAFREYYEHVVGDASGDALAGMIDALTTNFTSFYREPAHFRLLRETILPQLRGRPIAIWSAGCSTGEEAYSIAFALLDELGQSGLRSVRILATDISTRALKQGRLGIYAAERAQGFTPEAQRRYFLKGEREWRGWFRIKPEIAKAVQFRRVNLIEAFPADELYSVIFCRNVMIYFDGATQQRVVNRLASCLEPGGYFLTGHAESLTGLKHSLSFVAPAVYRLGKMPSGWNAS